MKDPEKYKLYKKHLELVKSKTKKISELSEAEKEKARAKWRRQKRNQKEKRKRNQKENQVLVYASCKPLISLCKTNKNF